MVCIGQRYEAFRVFGDREQPGRVLDPHRLVDRGVEQQRWPSHQRDPRRQASFGDIVEKFPAYAELAAAQRHFQLAFIARRARFRQVPRGRHQVRDVARE